MVIQKYYINKLMFSRKRSIIWTGQSKFPGPVWQASPTFTKHEERIKHTVIPSMEGQADLILSYLCYLIVSLFQTDFDEDLVHSAYVK